MQYIIASAWSGEQWEKQLDSALILSLLLGVLAGMMLMFILIKLSNLLQRDHVCESQSTSRPHNQ